MGWFQANMLYEKVTKLPPFSTPTGIMFLLVFKMRQSIEFQKSRVLVQAMMSQQGANDEHIKNAFADLKEAFFPFDKNQREAELKKMKEAMEFWVKQGPVSVEAQMDPRQAIQRASKLAKGKKDLENRMTQSKAGRFVDIDSFSKAKRRNRGSNV